MESCRIYHAPASRKCCSLFSSGRKISLCSLGVLLVYKSSFLEFWKTSRDRLMSAPYPRLKTSKRTSKCQFTVLENRKTKKNGPSGAPGPASASPWCATRGILPKLSTFLSQFEEGTLWRKNKFSKKKSHNAEKLKGGPFGIFKHSICCKISKKMKGGIFWREKIFRKKVSQCRKTERGDPLGFSNISSVAKEQKN